MQHRVGRTSGDVNIPLIGLDYAFPEASGGNGDHTKLNVLVATGRERNARYNIPSPAKGIDEFEWSVRSLLRLLGCLCYPEVMLTCDQESAFVRCGR